MNPLLLFWSEATCSGFYLDGQEDGQPGADHGLCDGDGAPANQVSGSLGEAKGDEPAGAWIWQAADLVPERPHIGVGAECKADLLLEDGLGVSHAYARCCRALWTRRAQPGE